MCIYWNSKCPNLPNFNFQGEGYSEVLNKCPNLPIFHFWGRGCTLSHLSPKVPTSLALFISKGGGSLNQHFRERLSVKFLLTLFTVQQTFWCITDSLRHTKYMEINKQVNRLNMCYCYSLTAWLKFLRSSRYFRQIVHEQRDVHALRDATFMEQLITAKWPQNINSVAW